MILVTGATGRIGRHLVPALLKKGEKVRVLVRDQDKARGLWGGSVQIIHGDIMDRSAVFEAMKGIDVVYHLAAQVSNAPRKEMFRINLEGTRNILEAGHGKRLVYLSSSSVYGKIYGKGSRSTITEKTPFVPTDVYGESKAAADKLARELGAVVLRPTLVYGPGCDEGFLKLFGMVKRMKAVIAGSGKNRLQWTHVDDLVSALVLAKDKGRPGEAYDIVSDDARTQEELLGVIARVQGVKPPKLHVPLWLLRTVGRLFVKSSAVDTIAADRIFDCTKAKRELGWQPKVRYEEGIGGALKHKAECEGH
ncbi:MAG: NAD-dependent epimerase/dehydratase family protein [Candidatus Aenigmatarchaeota archaeon]